MVAAKKHELESRRNRLPRVILEILTDDEQGQSDGRIRQSTRWRGPAAGLSVLRKLCEASSVSPFACRPQTQAQNEADRYTLFGRFASKCNRLPGLAVLETLGRRDRRILRTSILDSVRTESGTIVSQ
jgi:hypothetical protein